MNMTKEDEKAYNDAMTCWICDRGGFNQKDKKYMKVRDHCHISGRYRGAAHAKCNLQLSIKPEKVTILVVFHNLRGFDGHLIMGAAGRMGYEDSKISCIPNNMEKYMSFSF